MRIALHTMGCRLNQADGDSLQAQLVAAGHRMVDDLTDAQIYVLNSCTITRQADVEAGRLIRRVRRQNPRIRVLVTGCWAQRAPEDVALLEGVEWVIGNPEKTDLTRLLGGSDRVGDSRSVARPGIHVSVDALRRRLPFPDLPAAVRPSRTRPLLKVQDGCDYRCSFCIVPAVRGNSRSLAPADVLRRLDEMVEAGAPEIVVTGVHLGTYGRDLRPRVTLADLVAAALPRLNGARLRLSSVDPHEIDDDLVTLMRDNAPILCRHLHLPVQSGDPSVLRSMRRAHTPRHFQDGVARLVEAVPGIALGTDVIVGYPGETEEAFERTRSLLSTLPLAYLHVFPYSPRDGTVAATLPEQVPRTQRDARSGVLRRLSDDQERHFRSSLANSVVSAVVYRKRDRRTGLLVAITDNYVELTLDGPDRLQGRVVDLFVNADGETAKLAVR